MKRILTTLITLSLLALLVPVANAAETVTEDYTGTAGSRILGYGTTPSWRPCPEHSHPLACDPNGDGENEVPDVIKFGGGPLFANGVYSNVIITVSDDIYGSNAGIQACFWNPEGQTTNICEGESAGGEDYLSPTVCGPIAFLGSPYPSDRITVWVYTQVVTEDLETCGGFSGTMTGDFF